MQHANERLRSRHPFQLYLLGAAAFVGLLGLLNPDARPRSVWVVLGPSGSLLWCLFLAAGALIALIGVLLRDRATGLILEGGGCLTAGVTTLFHVTVAVWALGWDATVLGLLAGFGLACLARVWQIRRVLHVAGDRHRGKW